MTWKMFVKGFYDNLNTEINWARVSSSLIVLYGHFNFKLGKSIVKQDINNVLQNGKLLSETIDRYKLFVSNTLNLCEGLWTQVTNKDKDERSIINYLTFARIFLDNVSSLCFDAEKRYCT